MKKISELFFGYWKKPILDTDEQKKEERKVFLNGELAALESRWETIEILVSNDKLTDAKIIFKLFLLDLANFYQNIQDKKNFSPNTDLSSFVSQVEIPEKRKECLGMFAEITTIMDWDVLKTEIHLENSNYLLEYFRSLYSKQKKETLRTEYDLFKFATLVKLSSLTSLFAIVLGSYIYYSYKYPVLRAQNIKIYFLESKTNTGISDEKSVSSPIDITKKGEWIQFEWEIPNAVKNFGALRFDPLEQRGIRFSITDFVVLDVNDKILYKRKFDIGENLLPNGSEDFLSYLELKSVPNLKPGEILEMDSLRNNPQFTIVTSEIKDPKKIKLRAKFIETYLAKKK